MSRVIEIIDSDDDNLNTLDTPSTSFSSSTNAEAEDNQQFQSRRKPRKSALHAMSDPDMQFETIALEDDADTTNVVNAQQPTVSSSSRPYTHVRPQMKIQKSAPKILAPRPPTSAEVIESAFEEFLNGPEVKNDVYSVALERVRINYLLNLNGLPEINFSLYTQPERLQFQFEERLKQRQMMNNWDASRLQENRSRSLLQNNINNTGQDSG